jgi:hypothetical protein
MILLTPKTAAAAVTLGCALFSLSSPACTLYAAIGAGSVKDGGVIVARNRDWKKPSSQFVKTVRPASGYAYYGLFAGKPGAKNPGLNMGINEKGLFVAVSDARSLAKTARKQHKERVEAGLRERDFIANRAASVQEALEIVKRFEKPRYFILADRESVAIVEVPPGGPATYRLYRQGIAVHTNHYVFDEHLALNSRITPTTRIRLERMTELLKRSPEPMAVEDFIAMAHDHHDGSNCSIWRTGSDEKHSRTIAAAVAHIRPDGKVDFYLEYQPRHDFPGEYRTVRVSFDLGKDGLPK